MKAYERLQIAGPWLLGITFFVLAGLAIQLSTVQLRSVTFLYGSEQVLPDGPASFRGVVYDPLMNRTKESIEGRWQLLTEQEELSAGPITGYGEFIIDLEIPPRVQELRLSVSIKDSVLDMTTVQVPLLAINVPPSFDGASAPTKHQTWAFASDGKALLMKVHPLNAFDIVRGLPAPLLVEVRDEEGQPTSGTLVQIGDCSQETDEHGYVFCANVFTRSASLPIRGEHENTIYRGEFETSGHSQSLRPSYGEEATLLELETLPFRDIIHIDHWLGPYLIDAFDIPRQSSVYEWVPEWRDSPLPEFITAYRRVLNPNSTATFYATSNSAQRPTLQEAVQDLSAFHQSLGARVIPLLGSNKVSNEARVTNIQTHLKSRVAQLMLLLGISVVGSIIVYGYRHHKRRKERLRDWMLEADDDEFDPDVMLIGKTNHKVDIALGLAVLVSFLFGLYVMLTELLRWGWELI